MNKWWKYAVGYQIYPRSFKDSNQDGIGDLRGIIEKIPYLYDLGVTLIWICPFYRSPMDDNGYDVSDYRDVDPSFGTLEDFKELIKIAHRYQIKVILDLVLNHTSDEHQWFQKAISSKDHPYQKYYIFKEGKMIDGKKCPPNNWKGFFSESAWSYVESIDKYYLRIFSKKMPDLNWSHPELRQELYQVARFWLDLGCDGFRLDAIAHLAKDLSFKDSTINIDHNGLAFDPSKFSNRPEIFEYLKEFKEEVLDHYDCMTVGEVGGGANVLEGLKYANYQNGYLNMVFNFDTCWSNGAYGSIDKKDDEIVTDVVNLKENFKRWYDGLHKKAWLPIYWLNHDHPRVLSQYGNVNYRYPSGSMLGLILLFLYGTPFIYQGEEIGMSNVDYTRLSQFKDVGAQNYFQEHKEFYEEETILHTLRRTSRCNARSPMQWDASAYAGFSEVRSEVDVNGNYKEVNVQRQQHEKDSVLASYKQLIKLRKQYSKDVVDGSLTFIDLKDPNTFSFLKNNRLLIITNFKEEAIKFTYPLNEWQILFNNYKEVEYQDGIFTLKPYQALLIELLKENNS